MTFNLYSQNNLGLDYHYVQRQFVHDVQAPLAALTAITDCLDAAPDDVKTCYRMAVDRISEMVSDLKIKLQPRDSIRVSTQYVDLRKSIEDIITEKKISGKCPPNVALKLQCDDDHDYLCELDACEFKRMISNLINNSLEALDPINGSVVIGLSSLDRLCITITDNGRGIPSHLLHRVMERDFTHGKATGTGLGLYHAKTQIESWGGSLNMTSEEGVGTTIRISL